MHIHTRRQEKERKNGLTDRLLVLRTTVNSEVKVHQINHIRTEGGEEKM